MASRNDIPMTCGAFEALLSDALDGTLSPEAQERFAGHRASCATCGLMFREAEAGLGWLQGLKQAEAEPPSHLLHQILAATSGVTTGRQPGLAGEGWFEGLRASGVAWARSAFGPALSARMQPRFAMSFAMAFFSISILLNLSGVRLGDLRADDLRPSMISSRAMQGWGRVQNYYDNLRLVYEIESRVRELRNATTEEPATGTKDKNKTNRKDNTSGHPERRQNDDQYSSEFSGNTMAENHCGTAELQNCGIENPSAIRTRSEV